MADHSRNGVQALMNALQLVAPAVDPADPIAAEQLQSALRYLQFLRDRLDLLYDRERFELRHHLDMTDRLLECLDEEVARTSTLAELSAAGHATWGRVGANVPEMRTATARLAAAIASLVRTIADDPPQPRSAVERVILEATAERIMFERSWYLPLGFDHSPADVPPIDMVIAAERDRHPQHQR